MPTANEIRRQFIDFFAEKHGHTFVPSSPVVPYDDPTLLFTNAGMNQFKDVFLGTGSRPYKRAVNTQKCIRAGGKHNDLDDVGKDTYHHTFFEMLGNWSFGDYFKKEAIAWAWELLTGVWKLDKSRLHATVFEGDPEAKLARDDEAAEFWRTMTDIDPAHIHLGSKKDNFWEMGDTGPCGPCSEIHYDKTPDKSGAKLVNQGTPEVMEIWNLVFIQFNRAADKSLTPLPAKHVDTGMGFERLTAVLQGKDSNYDTDVFSAIMEAIGRLSAKNYTGKLENPDDVAFRVIADHLRMVTFAICDGATFSNKGRGSVMRSVLRRAVRFGWQCFGLREPFLYQLVPVVVDHMEEMYPELKQHSASVQEVIRSEERDFLRTIDRGLSQFVGSVSSTVEKEIADAIRKQMEPAQQMTAALQNAIKEQLAPIQRATEALQKAFREQIEPIQRAMAPLQEAMRQHVDPVQKAMAPLQQAMREHIEPTQKAMAALQKTIKQQLEPLRHLHASIPRISGADLFHLHTTYGFPPDLTRQMASEYELETDEKEYERLMREHEEISRAKKLPAATGLPAVFTVQEVDIAHLLPPTDDTPKWSGTQTEAQILGWVKTEGEHSSYLTSGDFEAFSVGGLVLDNTCYYAESGGQVSDTGETITTATGVCRVFGVRKVGKTVIHSVQVVEGRISIGQTATVSADTLLRDSTRRNHTTTHLLNWALRKVLGEHIEQRGSLVDPEKTRFDFAHNEPITPQEIAEVERLVNEKIYADLPVKPIVMPLAEAKKIQGVRAVFGEKYPDPVRVLLIGAERPEDVTAEHSVEFCGGTHLQHTGQAGFFKITSQEAVGKGVRRLTAVTGKRAVEEVQRLASVVDSLTGKFRCQPEDLPARIEGLEAEIKKLQQQLKKGAASDLQGTADKLFEGAADVNGSKIIVGEIPSAAEEQLRQQVDRLRQKAGSAIVVLGWADDGKVGLLAAVTDDLVKKGAHAGKLVGQVAKVVGGGGGGKPTMAQAGGKDPAKLGEALELARKLAVEQLGK